MSWRGAHNGPRGGHQPHPGPGHTTGGRGEPLGGSRPGPRGSAVPPRGAGAIRRGASNASHHSRRNDDQGTGPHGTNAGRSTHTRADDGHRQLEDSGTGDQHTHQSYQQEVQKQGAYIKNSKGHFPRGRFYRGRFQSRGCGSAWMHLHSAGGKDEGAPSAGESLLSFKRAVRHMNTGYARSVMSESCTRSVSEFGDASSQCGGNDCDADDVRADPFYYDQQNLSEEGCLDTSSRHADYFEDLTDSCARDYSQQKGQVCREPPTLGGPVASSSIGMISVFWDIENCAVPVGVPAYEIVRKVRRIFYPGHREVDFIVACDIGRIKPVVVRELDEAHVTVIHVPGDQKNAADDKLRSVLRRFSDSYKLTGSRIVLISGDVDFAAEIHEMRYRDIIHIVLIHNDQAKRSLTDAANRSIRFSKFVEDLKKDGAKESTSSAATGRDMLRAQKLPLGRQEDIATTTSSESDGARKELTINRDRAHLSKISTTTDAPVTKVGLLVTKEPTNSHFWKEYFSKVSIPQNFILEVGSCGRDIVCLVYYSADKARQAMALLKKQAMDDDDMPVCLGILSTETSGNEQQTVCEEPHRAKKVKAVINAQQHRIQSVQKKIASLPGNDQAAREQRKALEKLSDSYVAQLTEFTKTISQLPSSPELADSITAKEAARLRRAYHVYSVKGTLRDSLEKRQIALLITSPGSGTSLDVASYVQHRGCRVLSIQPNELVAEQCAQLAASMSDIGPAECWLYPKQQISPASTVVFTTARHFFHEFLRCGTALACFEVIIVDGLESDCPYQHVALLILRRHFVSHVRLILCTRDPDTCPFIQDLFCLGMQDVIRCELRFPVSVIWKGQPTNRVAACVAAALEYCQKDDGGGDVLTFLPSLTDAFLADGILAHELKMKGLNVDVTHEVLLSGMTSTYKTVASSESRWRIVFAVECPDVVVSALRIRCVIDSGLVLKPVYRNGVIVKQLAYVSEKEAEDRKSLAGARDCGTCYRLYSRDAFTSPASDATGNTRFMEDIVLRLLNRQTETSVSFLEKVPKELLKDVKRGLLTMGAINIHGKVTELGTRLCQTSLEPRLGKLVLGSAGRIPGFHAVVLAILAFEDPLVVYKPLYKDGSRRPQPAFAGGCTFSRIIEVYREWLAVPKKMKTSWCDLNGINEAIITRMHNTALAVQSEFEMFKGRNLCADSLKQEKDCTFSLGELLAESFPEGLLQASSSGYQHPVLGNKLKVSHLAVSDVQVARDKRVVCCLFAVMNGAKKPQLLNFCALPSVDSLSETKPVSLDLKEASNIPRIQERFGPVGNLIWNYQFKLPQALKAVQEDVKKTGGANGSLTLDEQKQCVLITGTKHYCLEARLQLQCIITEQVTKLAKKDKEAFLTPRDSPYNAQPVLAVVSVGGRVDEILSPTTFRTVVFADIKIPLPEFRRKVNDLGDIVQYWFLKKENAFQITYKTAEQADAAYRTLSEQRGELRAFVKGPALEHREEQRARRPAFHAKVSLARRLCTGIAFAELKDQESFDRIVRFLPLRLELDGAEVTCDRNKKVSCQLYIHGLPPAASQLALEKLLRASLPVDFSCVRLIHEPPRDTSTRELRRMECAIQRLFDDELGSATPKLSLKPPNATEYIVKGWMSFQDPVAAQSSCVLLKGAAIPLPSGPEKTELLVPLSLHTVVEETFFFPCHFFVAVQSRVEAELRRQEGLRPEDNLKCDATPCGELVRVKLQANNLNDFQKAVHLLNMLLLGSDAPRVENVLPIERLADVVRAAAPPRGIYIYTKLGETRLVGDVKLTSAAIEMVKKQAKALEKRKKKKLALVSEEFSLLRAFMEKFGDDPWELAKECKLDTALFDDRFEAVDVVGTDAAIAKAEELLGKLPKQPVEAGSALSDECCPICRVAPLRSDGGGDACGGHRLELCGHLHCNSCLRLAFKRGPLPLACFKEDCASPWAVADITHVTRNDAALLRDLAVRSLERAAAADGSGRWEPCPTPECQFAWDVHRDAEGQGVHVLGEVHICPACTNPVCFKCGSLFHYGMSCSAFKDSLLPARDSNKMWLSKDRRNRAICPACKARVERHSVDGVEAKVGACWACRRLFCWNCHRSFEDDAAAAREHRVQNCCRPTHSNGGESCDVM
ncbi:uncharacterized protein LOC144147053 isoform X1 [Haemaphysalis longicornis]